VADERNVFINCPYDAEYWPFFDAICFTIQACGFNPRCALETMDSGKNRMERIYQIISQSRFSVHDLSRVELNSAGLPRMNMPLELGIVLGARQFGGMEHQNKLCLVLDVEEHRYHKYISDISGQDIHIYSGDISALIAILRNFLSEFVGAFLPGYVELSARYAQYRAALPYVCIDLNLTEDGLSFPDRKRIIYLVLKKFQGAEESSLDTAYKLIALRLSKADEQARSGNDAAGVA